MKKVILLILSVLLIVAFAVPAMASVSFSGRILDSFITGFAPKEGKAAFNYYYAYVDLTAEVDEYNTVLVEFTAAPGMDYQDAFKPWFNGGFYLSALYLDTDVGAYFGLPVGVVGRLGSFWVSAGRKYEATVHAVERAGYTDAQINGVNATVDFGIGSVAVGTSIGENWGAAAGQTLPAQQLILNLPELGPVDFQAYMYGQGQEDFKPQLGANVKVGIDPVDAAAGFYFDMASEMYGYGVGATAGFGMFSVGAGLNGMKDDMLNYVNIEAGAEVMENVGVDVGVGLGLGSAYNDKVFDGAEISAYVKPGASTWRIGYIITENGYAHWSVVSLTDGGLFIQGDVTF
jgi:hypothetical protein